MLFNAIVRFYTDCKVESIDYIANFITPVKTNFIKYVHANVTTTLTVSDVCSNRESKEWEKVYSINTLYLLWAPHRLYKSWLIIHL